MTTAITYAGQALPEQIRKVSFTHTEEQLTYVGIHAVDPTVLEALMAALRVDDETLVIAGAGYSETFELNSASGTQCTELRTAVEKVGEDSDAVGMVLVRFSVTAKFQSFRTDGFRRYSFNFEENEQGIFTLTVQGEVTGKGTTTAYTTFLAGIEAIENLGKALLGDDDDGNLANTLFEDPQTFIQPLDRHNGTLSFSRTFLQLPDPANIYNQGTNAEERDATIVFPTWEVTRTDNLRKGLDEENLTMYSVRWSARMKKTKDQTAFISQYETQIQALVIKRIKEIFSESDTLVLEENTISYGRTQQSATGDWVVSSSDAFVFFEEELISDILFADSDQIADGEDFTEAAFSLGARLDMTQVVTHIQRGQPPATPPAPLVIFNGEALSMFLRRMTPAEGNQLVGKEVGTDDHKTGQVTEYTLKYRAEYRAFATATSEDFKKTVAGGEQMNIKGKVIIPNGG